MSKPRRRFALGALVLLIVVLAGGAAFTAIRLSAPLALLNVSVRVPPAYTLAPGSAPAIPVPASGNFQLDGGADVLATQQADVPRPIGSVAKTLTALLVLEHSPLPAGQPGPVLTMSDQDVALYKQAVAAQGSYIPVASGEQLSERQLLLALLLPSANNVAETLARWVSGSRDTFVAALNARAQALQMTQTHFVDPSGYDPRTVSSAHDLVLLAQAALAVPALVELVSTRTAALPGGLTLANLDTLLGSEPGWLGIKTGWTPQAGGCLLFAARQRLAEDSDPVLLTGAVLGQPPDASVDPGHPELGGAFRAARAAVTDAFAGYAVVSTASQHPDAGGSVTAPWGARSTVRVAYGSGPPLVVRRGAFGAPQLSLYRVRAPLDVGAPVGEVTVSLGKAVLRWPVLTTQALPAPDWWWRVIHG